MPRYHWKVGWEPDAATVRVVVVPLLMVVESGWVVMAGGTRTVAVTVLELAIPAALLARTQKLADAVRAEVVKVLVVAPETGVEVSGELPRYHWKSGELPEAATVNVAVSPLVTVIVSGCVVIAGGTMTVINAVSESAVPFTLVALAQKLAFTVRTGVV